MVSPLEFFKSVADDTRLRCLLLLSEEKELRVGEITQALDQSQPKVSRHLAHLRSSGLLQDRRQGQWVYYRLNPNLPGWVTAVLRQTAEANSDFVDENLLRLQQTSRAAHIEV
ncbi:MAG: metalloregulator ArsR/SmtB family transcription factor [Granulosicoccaceae bacterium]